MKVYISLGTTTTLKIYNKFLEFEKHDKKRLYNLNFNIDNYISDIQGFIRFECEIKKKKLKYDFNSNYVRVVNISYEELREIWESEFMKFLKMFDNELKVVRDKNAVKNRLYTIYNERKASLLYNFYLSICVDGLDIVRKETSKPTFYRNIKLLKEARIDFSQKYKLDLEDDFVDFNPFTSEEVA